MCVCKCVSARFKGRGGREPVVRVESLPVLYWQLEAVFFHDSLLLMNHNKLLIFRNTSSRTLSCCGKDSRPSVLFDYLKRESLFLIVWRAAESFNPSQETNNFRATNMGFVSWCGLEDSLTLEFTVKNFCP